MFAKTPLLAALAATMTIAATPAEARRGEQSDAREDAEAGKVKKLREIEASIVPRMRGWQYLGPEYDNRALVYRLKFLRDERVKYVDVDARTGGVLRER